MSDSTAASAAAAEERKRRSPVKFDRAFDILERIAKAPATTDELAAGYHASRRTIERLMADLARAKVPVVLQRAPGGGPSRWALDTARFVARFRKG